MMPQDVPPLAKLKGNRINGLYRKGDAFRISFDFGVVDIVPEGDCCSYSWIEHIAGVKDLVGRTIVGYKDFPETAREDDEYDHLALYGCALYLDNGVSVIFDYRNASNGYYGGWLNWYGPMDPQDADGWTKVEEDF